MEYPDDKPFPSRLILGYIDGRPMNEEKTMKCVICKEGETQPGKVTVTLERNGSTIIFREVPADVCDNCGEYYLTEELTEKLFERAENAIKNGAEVEILKFAA